MDTWQPISQAELEALIEKELLDCTDEIKAVFYQYAIPLTRYPIMRYGKLEFVFCAAIRDKEVMYYEDVEEGWNFSLLPQEGEALQHWCNQDELKFALLNWCESGKASKQFPLGPAGYM